MLKKRIGWLAVVLVLVLSIRVAGAQSEAVGGVYEIISGSYSECCGIGGNDFGSDLPNERQKFVRFTADAQRHIATLTFLAEDARTVFSTVPCPSFRAIDFSFDHGLIFSNRTVFHVDPGGPPYQLYWNYMVSNSANRLRLDGTVGAVRAPCTDVPTRFSHSNVVAVLMPGPRLSILDPSKDGAARVMVQGKSGWTDVIEASTDLVAWSPVSTNFMDFSLCPICPFAIFEDSASTNLVRRFYRSFEFR